MKRHFFYIWDDESEYTRPWSQTDLITFVPFEDDFISTSYGAHQLCVF